MVNMSIFALLLAATVANAPVPANAGVTIDVTEANTWVGSSIEVQTWKRPDISVDQEVRKGNSGDVRAVVTKNGSSVTVSAQYTGERKSYFFGLIRSTNGESFHWIVHMPADHRLTVREINGSIAVDGVTAPLDVRTSNGRVTIAGAGPVIDGRTSNGTIEATIATLSGGSPRITLESTNGGIRLHVPRAFAARVEANTVNGRVTNPLAGATGSGTATLKTTNGNIEVAVGG